MKAAHGKTEEAGMRAWTKRQRRIRNAARKAARYPKHRGHRYE